MPRKEDFRKIVGPLEGRTPAHVKAIATFWDPDREKLILRYYFSQPCTAEDEDMVSEVLGELIAAHWAEIKDAQSECIYAPEPISKLDSLDGWVYMRADS